VTSALVFDPLDATRARLEARQDLIVCGLEVARAVFARVDPGVKVQAVVEEGARVAAGTAIAYAEGATLGILAAERSALNFLGRMCGVATHTRRFVDAAAGSGVEIVDTRKTLPAWRTLDKYAAAVGGARNHRMGLFDGILLKDNHIAAAGGLDAAVRRALRDAPAGLRVQVEVQSEDEARAALAAGADFLLLDNLPPERIAPIARSAGPEVVLEASGGITLDDVRAYARSGARRLSIGALTHSAPNADVALEIDVTAPATRAGAAPGGASR